MLVSGVYSFSDTSCFCRLFPSAAGFCVPAAAGWERAVITPETHAIPSSAAAKAAIRKRLTDQQAAYYTDAIIDSFGGDKGIGLGSQVSQITELAVLDDLDHYIKERLRIKHYLRYMDDFILIHEDKE